MSRRRHVIRLGVPTLIVAGLAVAALWRIDAPIDDPADNSVRRVASLENVVIREVLSARALWIGDAERPDFVVLDPDVVSGPGVRLEAGARVTLIGLVRPAPPAAAAMRQWSISEAAARALAQRGSYLHATEIRRP